MSTFQNEFGLGAKIIIPSIQRDYIQPLNDTIINGFVEVLVTAFAKGENKDLNYLYGINNEQGEFIPIDGQQRLTTLWLLHLYTAARLGMGLNSTIEYQTRDISGDFCKALSDNLVSINFDKEKVSDDIKDAHWFIGCWYESVTVKSILIALDVIHKIIESEKADIHTMWRNMNAGAQSPVKFAFHNPIDLGKDIYVKMNSRGKALTQFENLKAWLDDRLKSYCRRYNNHSFVSAFYRNWRREIDNEWTDLFWRNRNINSAFPEEIDDAMLRLFYTIAYIVWAQKATKDRKKMNLKGNEEFNSDNILSRMRDNTVDIPIYELNRLDIFNEEVLLSVSRALTGLIKLEKTLNEDIQSKSEIENKDKIYFWDLPEVPLTFIYQLLLSEKDEKIAYPKIALAASLLYFAVQQVEVGKLLNWMRFSRNIVNNSRIDSENIHNVLSAFKKWAKQLRDKDWTTFVKDLEYLPAINKTQIDEEKEKNDWLCLHPECEEALHRLENHRFFFGRISFLMRFINSKQIENRNIDSIGILFNRYAQLLLDLFESDGPDRLLRKGYRFHRSVLALSEYYGYGVAEGSNWVLSNSKESWKDYLEDFGFDGNGVPHNIGFIRLLTQLKDKDKDEYLDVIKSIIYKERDHVSDWRKDLICHYDLWEYMEANNIRFDSNYKVILIKGVALGKRNRRSELRTRGLYSFLKKEFFKKNNEENGTSNVSLNGWSLNFWDWYGNDRKNSCLFFEKVINDNKIAIDVFFDTTQNNEDAYCIEIFDRKGQQEHSNEISEISLTPFEDLLRLNQFTWTDNGYVELRNLSRTKTVDILKEIIHYKA